MCRVRRALRDYAAGCVWPRSGPAARTCTSSEGSEESVLDRLDPVSWCIVGDRFDVPRKPIAVAVGDSGRGPAAPPGRSRRRWLGVLRPVLL